MLSPDPAKTSGNSPPLSSGLWPEALYSLYDRRNYGLDGLELLRRIPDASVPLVIWDPQYGSLLAAMKYGNAADNGRQQARRALHQQSTTDIWDFGQEIERILIPSGHVTLWIDTHMFCETKPIDIFRDDFGDTRMHQVDLIVWDKVRLGMGARSRHQCEFMLTFQKSPKRAKGCWRDHGIRDVWSEAVTKTHPHSKPQGLQRRIIECLTEPGDLVVNPCAGGFSTLDAALSVGRHFLGCEFLEADDPALVVA